MLLLRRSPGPILAALFAAAVAGAQGGTPLGEPLPDVAALPAALYTPPDAGADAAVAGLWRQSEALEWAGDYLTAAALRERLVERRPDDVHLHWRIARDLLHHAESAATADADELGSLYEQSADWARRGRALAPRCGECCLYEFAATGRLASVRGVAASLGSVRDAGRLLDECLEIPPTWRDERFGEERAHLYYGAAVYYRLLPDALWMRLVAGVRGNAEAAVGFARRAARLSPGHLAYRVELGAALLCAHERGGDAMLRAEALLALRSADEAPRARRLLEAPERACGDSAHGTFAWR